MPKINKSVIKWIQVGISEEGGDPGSI